MAVFSTILAFGEVDFSSDGVGFHLSSEKKQRRQQPYIKAVYKKSSLNLVCIDFFSICYREQRRSMIESQIDFSCDLIPETFQVCQ